MKKETITLYGITSGDKAHASNINIRTLITTKFEIIYSYVLKPI